MAIRLAYNVLKSVIFKEVVTITAVARERKICIVGLCLWLIESALLQTPPYRQEMYFLDIANNSPTVLESIVILLSHPEEPELRTVEDQYLEDLEEVGYQASSARLMVLVTPSPDPAPYATDLFVFFAQQLVAYNQKYPGQVLYCA